MTGQRSAITRINEQLKQQRVPYQLVRGRGYYYLRMLDGAPILPSTMLLHYQQLQPSDYAATASEVRDLLSAGGIAAKFD